MNPVRRKKRRRGGGQLVHSRPPVSLAAQDLAARATPVRAKRKPQYSDFAGMLLAGVVADNWLNFHRAGVPFTLQPEDYPLLLAPGVVTSTTVDVKEAFDHYMAGGTAVMRRTTVANIGIPEIRYVVDVQQWDLGADDHLDNGWVSLSSLFGQGRYPSRFAIPLVLSANTQWHMQFINREAFPVELFVQFYGRRKVAGTVT